MVRALILPLLGGAMFFDPRPDPVPDGGAAADELIVLVPEGQASEAWFILEEERGDPAGRGAEPPAGTVCLRRRLDERGLVLEADFRFPGAEARVLLTEEVGAVRRLVYRELSGNAGRSLVLEELPEGVHEVVEWGGPRRRTWRLEGGPALRFPLELCELFRAGETLPAVAELFDPLAGDTTRVRVDVGELEDEVGLLRQLRLVRGDGTLAAEYVVRAGEITTFTWQRGGLRARRVAASEATRVLRTLDAVQPE